MLACLYIYIYIYNHPRGHKCSFNGRITLTFKTHAIPLHATYDNEKVLHMEANYHQAQCDPFTTNHKVQSISF